MASAWAITKPGLLHGSGNRRTFVKVFLMMQLWENHAVASFQVAHRLAHSLLEHILFPQALSSPTQAGSCLPLSYLPKNTSQGSAIVSLLKGEAL